MLGKAILWRSRNFAVCSDFASGSMSSSDTPAIATSAPNASSIARRSGISATHGMHHIAHTFSTRTFAAGGNTDAIFTGSFTLRRSAPKTGSVSRTLRNEAANGAYFGIGTVHLHFDRAVRAILLRRLRVIAEQVLRAQILLDGFVRSGELFGIADQIHDAARLRRERAHLSRSAERAGAKSESDSDEVQRDSRRASVREHVVVRSEERRVGKECRSRWSPYD